MPITNDKTALGKLIKRRHPRFEDFEPHWDFLEATYQGGRDWFKPNIFKYLKEGAQEFKDRIARAYRFNHSREVVDLINKYIFKAEVHRNDADASQEIKNFWKEATLDRRDIAHLMRQVSQRASIMGRIYVVVDTTASDDAISVADERNSGGRVYAYTVGPQKVLDMSFDDEGVLNWILIHEAWRDDEDPIDSSGKTVDRFRLWTREEWTLLEARRKTRNAKPVVVKVREGEHGLGVVPVIPVDHIETDDAYTAPALIGDIAYLDRAVANYLSNLDAIIQDQTFSQLAIPSQGLMPGEDNFDKLMDMGTKRIFVFDGEGGARPDFISPDVKQAELIIHVITRIITEIYHSVGMAGERTKQDNAVGIDNSSGVAKAFDFERMNALLSSKSANLEHVENQIMDLVMRWNSSELNDSSLVKYPDDFDVRGLFDELELAERLSLVDAPDSLRREQMNTLVDKLYPRLAEELREKIRRQIETDWPPTAPEIVAPRPSFDSENRQGQVTDQTE